MSLLVDGNSRPYNALDSFEPAETTPADFAGATTNARGDKDGTNAAFTLFNVTGDVLVRIWGVCTTLLTEAAGTSKIEVGITGNTALLIAQTSSADIDANEIWFDSTPAIGDTLANLPGPTIIPNGLDIIETTSTQDINSGQVYYICLWRPLSRGSTVVDAN